MWSMVTDIGEALGQIIKSQRKVKPKVVFIATEDEIIEYEEKCIAMNLNYLCGLSKNI